MSLPFLPGNTFDRKFAQNKHHLSHHFDKFNGVNVMGETKPGVGGQPLPGQDLRPKNSLYPRGEGADRPAWVAFDKQVLSFDGYFQESVVERAGEQYRVRKVKILFYLEDDTIQVSEPRVKNAGYNQGTIINRHRIPRARPYDNTFYTVEDLNVQREIEFYGKKFKITDCDAFTRNFLTKLGVRVPDPIQSPADPYQNIRGIQDGAQNPLRPYERVDSLKQFLEHDRQVLRFDCVWDDRDTKFGELRRFKLHYYLADDTIEILEKLPPNCGRDSNSTFLSRQKLPKEIVNMGKPGDKPTRTVLNVIGNFFDGGRYILDNLKTGAINVNYYQDGDLMINRIVNVFGRKMLITDCDEFTKNYYANKYGVSNFEPVQYDRAEYGGGRRLERTNPPYNGFGSEEDSLASCNKMIPEPPKKDFVKWIQYDRNGLESNILRYLAKLNVKDPIQAERRFVISFFPSDDSILVHEPPIKNSGVSGGKFLERMKIKKPDHPPYSTQLPDYFSASDFHVGARLLLNQFDFTILDADEYCFKFMESNTNMFPFSDVQAVKRKLAHQLQPDQLAALESALRHADAYHSGVVSYRAFMNAACGTLGSTLNEQEIITLARSYALETRKDYDDQSVAAAAQENLRKNNFDLFTRLRETLQNCDTYTRDSGACSLNEARSVCKGFRLPMPDYLLDMVLQNSRNETGDVDVRTLVGVLNWKENPIQNPRSSSDDHNKGGSSSSTDEAKILFQTTTLERLQLKINYEALISDLRH